MQHQLLLFFLDFHMHSAVRKLPIRMAVVNDLDGFSLVSFRIVVRIVGG